MDSIANVIPFAMDQLRDAPARESSLFITWYYWTVSASLLVVFFIVQILFHQEPFHFINRSVDFGTANNPTLSLTGAVSIIILSIFGLVTLTVSLAIMHRRPTWFNIEPGSINPYKLVYKVTKFAYYQFAGVPSPTVRMSCLLDLILGKASMVALLQ